MGRILKMTSLALVAVVVLGSCGGGDEATERAAGGTQQDEGLAEAVDDSVEVPTSTFTGDKCIYSGPDTFSSGEIVSFTVRNYSWGEAFLSVVEVPPGTTLEAVVADFPVIEDVVPPKPAQTQGFRHLAPGAELLLTISFSRPGQFGTACIGFDGQPGVPGAPLTVEAQGVDSEGGG